MLLRPDGQGIYLAQMLPTQAYVFHNGHLSALPEPASWQRPGKVAVTLRRVPDPGLDMEEEPLPALDDESLPAVTLPSTPLGSGPGVEVDLLFRRVEAGDLVAIVSSSLARQLDRSVAESIFASGSADETIDGLYTLAMERGLAQAHACVLQLGVETASGVDTDLPSHTVPFNEARSAHGEPVQLAPEVPTREMQSEEIAAPPQNPLLRFEALKAPRQWLSRLKPAEPQATEEPLPQAAEGEQTQDQDATPNPDIWTDHPPCA